MPKRLNTKEVFRKGRFIIKDVELELDNGNKTTFQYWDKPDTAIIVPILKNGDVVFITEYQVAFDIPMLSLPKGRIEDGEVSFEVANKELQEEIGYRADKLDKIAIFTTIPGYLSNKTHVYIARDLVQSKLDSGDEEWEMTISHYPLEDFEKLIDENKLAGARMIAALYEARRFLSREN
jgi:ADP-ribose diphosphatase